MKRYLLILLILTILPVLSLLTPGLPVTHDGQDHVARIANFSASLSEGNIVPRWANNLNWGFGHPILMFLYPLPSYAASFFHSVGFSLVDSTKFIFALSVILSAVTMFLWAREEWGDQAGFFAALLYTFAPYRFVDLYVRGALGETVAFVFLPLLLLGVYGVAFKKRQIPYRFISTLATVGLILSHNAVSLMFLPLVFLYSLYCVMRLTPNERGIKIVLIWATIVFGFALSAFFWIPAFFEGKYTLRDIVTKGEVITRMVPFLWFFYSPWKYAGGDELTKQLGFVQWGTVFAAFLLFVKTKSRNNRLLLSTLFLLFISTLFLMTSPAVFIWNSISLLQKFQFPWRFLTLSVFITAVLGAVVMNELSIMKHRLVLPCLTVVLLLSTFFMWKPVAYKIYPESFFTSVYDGTTDTGESSPIWSVRFMESRPPKPMEVISGNADILPKDRTTTSREYTVRAIVPARIVENTLYFPGWNVYVDGQPVEIQFQDPDYRGRITFSVAPGDHTVRIRFENTKVRSAANWISGLSLLVLIFLTFAGSIPFQGKKRTVVGLQPETRNKK